MQQFIINTLKILKIHLIFIDRMMEITVRFQFKTGWINTIYNHTIFYINIRLCQVLLRLNCTASSPTLSVSSPFYTSIKAASVAKKGLPNSRGTWVSSFIFITTKSTGKINFPTLTSTSSRTPSGCAMVLSSICNVIVVGVSSPKLSLCTTDKGIKLMLALESHKASLN